MTRHTKATKMPGRPICARQHKIRSMSYTLLASRQMLHTCVKTSHPRETSPSGKQRLGIQFFCAYQNTRERTSGGKLQEGRFALRCRFASSMSPGCCNISSSWSNSAILVEEVVAPGLSRELKREAKIFFHASALDSNSQET